MKLKTLLAVVLFALIFQGNVGAAAGKADPAVPQVELYVTSWCPYCKQAENFFRAQGLPFTVYDVEKDSAAARRKEGGDFSRAGRARIAG